MYQVNSIPVLFQHIKKPLISQRLLLITELKGYNLSNFIAGLQSLDMVKTII